MPPDDPGPRPEERGDLGPAARRPPLADGSGSPPADRLPPEAPSRTGAVKEVLRLAVGLAIGLVGVAEGLVAAALNEVTRGSRDDR